MGLLDGKTAIVTGGSSGIGRGICMEFAEQGADVAIADVRATPRLREDERPTHEWIREETDQDATYIECDVSDPDDVDELVSTTEEEHGGIDALVNNAAIAVEDDFDVTPEEFDEFMGINIAGCFYPARAVAGHMIENDVQGSITMVSSTEAIRTPDDRPVYGSTRGALRNMTYALAGRLGTHGVRVNTLLPGLFRTAMVTEDIPLFEDMDRLLERIPLERHGEPREAGGAAAFLASDLASYVTGAELLVDGGITYVSR